MVYVRKYTQTETVKQTQRQLNRHREKYRQIKTETDKQAKNTEEQADELTQIVRHKADKLTQADRHRQKDRPSQTGYHILKLHHRYRQLQIKTKRETSNNLRERQKGNRD